MKTITRWFFLAISSVFIAVSLSVIIIVGLYLTGQYITPDRTCITGKMLLEREGTYIDLGEMEFCGNDLSVSGVYGPSMEYHFFILKRKNAELKEQLEQCMSRTSV